jgi:hypothetical protein
VSVLWYGTDTPPPREVSLRAGPLTLIFEPELAQIRYIRLGEREVVRAVYAAVRDRSWGTVAPVVRNLRLETTDDSFSATFDVSCRQADIDFLWHGVITGDGQGAVRFDFDGKAQSTFLRNRLGFCVLHPIDGCAGEPVTIRKADGSEQRGKFPSDISPHQPFMDIRSIRHTIQPGIDAQVTFEGDVFEMEDHRNWTDASYKTYCTPLGLPFPVQVRQGTNIQQSVTLRLIGNAPRAVGQRATRSELLLDVANSAAGRLPALGLGMATDSPTLTAQDAQRIRALNIAHLRVDLRLAGNDWPALLSRAAREAGALGCALEIALNLGPRPDEELERFVPALRTSKVRVARHLVFQTDSKTVASARKILGSVVSGTDVYFTELNRERPAVAHSDGVCYSVNPQVHAFDNMSLVETLPMHGETVKAARKFSGSLPISVTPVTLKPRTSPDPVDPRQMSLFGAGWTLGSLKYLAESGAASATYYETTGRRGVMTSEEVFPIYHVLADVGEFAGGEVLPVVSSDPLRFEALLLRKGARTRLLLANLTGHLQQVRIPRAPLGKMVRVCMLDEHTVERAMALRREPGAMRECTMDGVLVVSLLPYAVARVDQS